MSSNKSARTAAIQLQGQSHRIMIAAAITLAAVAMAPTQARADLPLGAILGGAAGGILGNQVGGGTGKAIATGAGAVVGALAGDRMQYNMRSPGSQVIVPHGVAPTYGASSYGAPVYGYQQPQYQRQYQQPGVVYSQYKNWNRRRLRHRRFLKDERARIQMLKACGMSRIKILETIMPAAETAVEEEIKNMLTVDQLNKNPFWQHYIKMQEQILFYKHNPAKIYREPSSFRLPFTKKPERTASPPDMQDN